MVEYGLAVQVRRLMPMFKRYKLNLRMGATKFKVQSSEFRVRRFENKYTELRTNYSELFASKSGMTFIEVILVMAIIGILSAVLIPKFNFAISSKASADGAAYMIASDIRYAQEFAMANRISKSVNFTTGSSIYTFSPTHNLDPSGQLPSGVKIDGNFTITFNSLGEPTTGGDGSVSITGGGLTKAISVVNYTGKVNIS
jgi:prepilin-type N-terminal cleavage/methylation domain-containing protein